MIKEPRILIIEDRPADAELAVRELRKAQLAFEFKRVETPESFLEALEQFNPDIILSDYGLPQFTGLDALHLLKERNLDLPFILCTGSLTEEVAVECMKEGATDYILKSSLKRLPTAVLNALEKSESRKTKEQATAALRESEMRYRHLFDSNPYPIWVYDLETLQFLAVNEEAVRHYGYSREEFLNLTIKDICPLEDIPLLSEYLTTSVAEDKVVREVRHRKKDGTVINVEIAAQTITFDGRRARLSLVTDITERKRTEEALEKSEEKYRELVENINEILYATDERGLLTYISPAIERSIGYNYSEVVGRSFNKFVHPEDLPGVIESFRQSIFSTVEPMEFRIFTKTGDIRWARKSSRAVFHGGRFVGTRGSLTDVTERKQAEEALHQSQLMLQLVMDTIPQAVFWKDRNSVFLGCNRVLAQIVGLSDPAQIIGKTDYDFSFRKEETDFFIECDRRVMESGVPEYHIVEPQLQADGTEAWLDTNKVPLRDAKGNVIGILGTFEDITERRRADAALRESEYKMRTLLANMSEGLLQVDNTDSIQFVNNRLCEMVGYSADELVGTDWSRLLLEEERDFIKQVNERRLQGISDRYEIRLRKKSGEILWVIVGGAPIINAEGAVTGSMGVFTDITERKRAEEQLLHDAFHDGLTGLANRTLFMDHLRLTIERGKRRLDATFAILFLDFDRFKVINDSLGHTEGDNLLKQIAQRLAASLRPGDLVARLGGDEFTILLNELDDENDALRIAERIQEDLKLPFNLGGREVFTSASIGIALSTSGHNQAEDMLRDADIAMYRAKAKGKAQHQVFDFSMHEHASRQLQFETEMRHALERGEFCLHYQPIINLETRHLVGFEALVRWKHPTRGLVSPVEFIQAAEENGLILPLGRWILQESCRQLCRWQNSDPAASDLTVSVNLSTKQFSQPDLAEQVAAILEETGLKPHFLKLEITESHVMENTEAAVATMNRLRSLGIEISLDDFGTGYSSLSYLHRLPIDYLKIDRSFVSRMAESKENAEIVYTIIKLAQNLKMKVIAEGIETNEQLAQLHLLNCEYGQGYFFSKPLEAGEAGLLIGSPMPNLEREVDSASVNFNAMG